MEAETIFRDFYFMDNNRVIKFRAWDKERKQMAQVLRINLSDLNGRTKQVEINNGCFTAYPNLEEVVLMQFTGLYAQHDLTKPIYEGDILKSNEHIDAVIWREDLCGFSFQNDKSRMNLVDWLENAQYSSTEIIGNIFENPDLLT